LERRFRPGEEPRRSWPVRAIALAALGAAVVVVLVLGLTGPDDDKNTQRRSGKHQNARREPGGSSNQGVPARPVTVSLITRDSMEVCLVTGDGRALLDGQTLISGTEEGPFNPPAENYRLDLTSGGALTLTLDGKPRLVSSRDPVSYQISDGGVRPTGFKGPDCP
jgi:hypothetical protein